MALKYLSGLIRCNLCSYILDSRRYSSKFPRSNKVMLKECVNTTFFHRWEEDSLRITLLMEREYISFMRISFDMELKAPIWLLLKKINSRVSKTIKSRMKTSQETKDFKPAKATSFLLLNGEPICEQENCSIIFSLNGDLKLKLFHDYYVCLVNVPWVLGFKLPENPVPGVFIYPTSLKTLFTEKYDLKWFRNSIKPLEDGTVTWTQVGENFHYMVEEEDISHYLKLKFVPINKNSVGPSFELITKNAVESNLCSYYYLNTHKLTENKIPEDMFRFVSYNVLADYYVSTKEGQKYFDYCPSHAINKIQRSSAVLKELIGYKSDLICLQEVCTDIYELLLLPKLKELGFNGLMCPKICSEEGTVCFYNDRKFKLLFNENFNYGCEIHTNKFLRNIFLHIQGKSDLFDKFTSLKHCVQFIVLQSKIRSNEILIIGNIHLYSNPKGTLIRILQVAAVFELLKQIFQQLEPLVSDKKVSFIFCGDFNSEPSSPIHDFIKNSSIPDVKMEDKDIVDFDSSKFGHLFKLESACGTPLYTNYTRDFQGCLDYIYYETDKLQVEKVYPMAGEEELSLHVGIPSVSFPSDHIPLIVDFKWK